jgi:hypothetical protein
MNKLHGATGALNTGKQSRPSFSALSLFYEFPSELMEPRTVDPPRQLFGQTPVVNRLCVLVENLLPFKKILVAQATKVRRPRRGQNTPTVPQPYVVGQNPLVYPPLLGASRIKGLFIVKQEQHYVERFTDVLMGPPRFPNLGDNDFLDVRPFFICQTEMARNGHEVGTKRKQSRPLCQ